MNQMHVVICMLVLLRAIGRSQMQMTHHASLCIAAYGFLVAERCLFPPRRQFIRERIKTPALPRGFRPRGAADPT